MSSRSFSTPLMVMLLAVAAAAQAVWPAPPEPPGNPTTPTKVLLGKALFWDEQLASTNSVACGTCHVFSHGGADPRAPMAVHPGPDGVFGTSDDGRGSPGVPASDAAGSYRWVESFGIAPQITARTAPTVINAAYQVAQFWDGRAEDKEFRDPVTGALVLHSNAFLENQIAEPPLSAIEMGHPGRDWQDVVTAIVAAPPLALASRVPAPLAAFVAGRTYPQLFDLAFGSPGVDASRAVMAIAAYMRTLVADESPIDRFLQGRGPFPQRASPGFVEFGVHCSQCHKDLSNFSVVSGPASIDFRNIGVRPIAEDRGRYLVTGQLVDDGRFKSPDLRNVALRGPFFHNGSARTLNEVLHFYDRGGDFPANRDPLMQQMQGQLPPATRAAIIAFLGELSDPRVVAELPPFDRPRLFSEGVGRNVVFGQPSVGGAGNPPRVVAVEPPRLGRGFATVAVDGARPGEHAFLGLDIAAAASPLQFGGIEVLLALTPAATLQHAGRLERGVGPHSGHLSHRVGLPSDPSLAGLELFGQWFLTDPVVPGGLTATRAFRWRLLR